MTDNIKVVNVKSIYGQRTRQPLVEITIPDGTGTQENGQLVIRIPENDARALALNILQAAEASLVDAFLIEFMRSGDSESKSRFDEPAIAKLITAFRGFRNKRST
jgi:hypothetical protein